MTKPIDPTYLTGVWRPIKTLQMDSMAALTVFIVCGPGPAQARTELFATIVGGHFNLEREVKYFQELTSDYGLMPTFVFQPGDILITDKARNATTNAFRARVFRLQNIQNRWDCCKDTLLILEKKSGIFGSWHSCKFGSFEYDEAAKDLHI